MFLAIAVENKQHPHGNLDYRIWYLELNSQGKVIEIGVKSKNELIQSIFENFQKTGQTKWRAFEKGSESSRPIEIFDFISMNLNENTHFGNLPTLSEFQLVLDQLQLGIELRATA
jgi:hypothetical protein